MQNLEVLVMKNILAHYNSACYTSRDPTIIITLWGLVETIYVTYVLITSYCFSLYHIPIVAITICCVCLLSHTPYG